LIKNSLKLEILSLFHAEEKLKVDNYEDEQMFVLFSQNGLVISDKT